MSATEPRAIVPTPDSPATQRQLRYLQAVAREAGYDGAALDNRAQQEFGCDASQLSRRDASTRIDLIQRDTKQWGGKHDTPS